MLKYPVKLLRISIIFNVNAKNISVNTENIKNIDSRVTTNANAIVGITESVKANATNINTVNNKVESVKTDINKINAKVDKNSKDIEGLKGHIGTQSLILNKTSQILTIILMLNLLKLTMILM